MKHATYQHELSNGMRLLLIDVPGAGSVSLSSFVQSGYRYFPRTHYETPHLLEHLMFSGTKRFPDSFTLNRELERSGAFVNGYTNVDSNSFRFEGAKTDLFRLSELMMELLFEATLSDADLESEREAVINELSEHLDDDDDRSDYYSEQALVPSLKPGWRERLEVTRRLTMADIRAAYRRYFVTANTGVIIATALPEKTRERVIERLELMTAGYRRGHRQTFKKHPLADFAGHISLLLARSQAQTRLNLRFLHPGYDLPDLVPLRIFTEILGGSSTAPLAAEVRQAGLSYGINADRYAQEEYSGLEITSQAPDEKLLPLLELITTILGRVAAGGFSDEELAYAKESIIGSIGRSYEAPRDFADWYEDRFETGKPLVSPETRLAEERAITRKDVTEAASRYVTKKNWHLTVVAPQTGGLADECRAIIEDNLGPAPK